MSVGSVGPGYCAMQHPGPMPPLDAAGTVGGDPSGARREVDETRQPATENRADGNGDESGHDVLLWFRGDVGADENHITGNPDTCQVGVKVLQTAIPLPAPRPMPRLPMYGWARLPMVCVGAPSDGAWARLPMYGWVGRWVSGGFAGSHTCSTQAWSNGCSNGGGVLRRAIPLTCQVVRWSHIYPFDRWPELA